MCREQGMAKLGNVAIDGTKVRANASKHKAMSYGRMKKERDELDEIVKGWLDEAERIDVEEDKLYGKGKRGDPKSRALRGELPEKFRDPKTRRANIEKALRELEARKKAEAEKKRAEIAEKEEKKRQKERETGKKQPGRKTNPPSEEPDDKMQYPQVRTFSGAGLPGDFTDPESRIMKMGSTGSFEQCYNAQVAVDADTQVIVAADVTQQANDPKSRALRGKKQLAPMVEQVVENTGELPEKVSVDNGYYSNDNVEAMDEKDVDAYIAAGKMKHGEKITSPRGRIPKSATTKDRMKRKLRTQKGRATYAKRKCSVEPVIGQVKDVQGFRQFLRRGLRAVQDEWRFGCAMHNLLKLFRRRNAAMA